MMGTVPGTVPVRAGAIVVVLIAMLVDAVLQGRRSRGRTGAGTDRVDRLAHGHVPADVYLDIGAAELVECVRADVARGHLVDSQFREAVGAMEYALVTHSRYPRLLSGFGIEEQEDGRLSEALAHFCAQIVVFGCYQNSHDFLG